MFSAVVWTLVPGLVAMFGWQRLVAERSGIWLNVSGRRYWRFWGFSTQMMIFFQLLDAPYPED
jgi:hypothetical protein